MIFQLLEGEAANPAGNNGWVSYVLIGVLLVVLVGSMFFMNRRNKKRDEEAKALIDAVKPGNKVKTIGGICGIVVEVNPEDDTFVLETGSEATGKSYMRFVRQAILESDAVVEKSADKKAVKEEKGAETAAAEVTEEKPAEEIPAETDAEPEKEESGKDKQ